jgi:hypothetical protein
LWILERDNKKKMNARKSWKVSKQGWKAQCSESQRTRDAAICPETKTKPKDLALCQKIRLTLIFHKQQ